LETTDSGTEVRRPIPDGTLVNFSIEQGGGNITNAKITKDGFATATYQGGTYGGLVTIKASVNENVFDTFSFEVAPGEIGSISVNNIVPESKVINVRGTGSINVANITFAVTDAYGNPVEDGRTVFFDIANPLNGGERLSTTEANTLNGLVSVAVQSGTVPGPLNVRAIYPSNDGTSISTEGQITIVSGRPDAEHISIAAEYLNIAGGIEFGLQDTITAYLGDRYGNVPYEETQVSFITEGGTIGESTGFTTTTSYGVAQAVLQTSAPTTPELDGNDPNANPGLCRIVAYTRGSESFYDANGNGSYDEGLDTLTHDMSDPYIDANDNGQFDQGEKYFDANGDGIFTLSDGIYQSDTHIWTSMNVLFSDFAAPLNLTPSNFDLQIGECQTFTCNVSDVFGNALVNGTTLSVEASAGEIIGLDNYTLADTAGPGFTFSFDLCSERDPDAEAKTSQVTVRLTPAGETATAPGNNGAELIELASGTINKPLPIPEPPPLPSPQVVFTLPNDGAEDVPLDQSILLVFNEAMNDSTFTGANIYIQELVEDGANIYYPIDVEFNSNDASQVELKHREDRTFEPNTKYMVSLRSDLESIEGQSMMTNYSFIFTTTSK
jgi:adhesin/invasin